MIGSRIGRYIVTSRFGAGSFGETWLAHDAALNRTVALRIFAPDAGSDETMRMHLLEEIRAAGAIEHPSIASVHDAGELPDGKLWVAMDWHGGQSLLERERAGPVPADEATGIAIQAGRGLQKAHQAGLVHCDLSPENLIVSEDGRARILVAFQGPAADEASEVSALQALLSGMLGRGANVPPELQRVIDGRYARVAEMVEALEQMVGKVSSGTLSRPMNPAGGQRRRARRTEAWGAAAAAVLIAAGVGGYFLWRSQSTIPETAGRVTIVLLPIVNEVVVDPDDKLGDRLTDGLMTDLVKIRGLRVISQNSARSIKAGASIAMVGKMLGVDYVLKGSAGREGEKALLHVALWKVAGERKTWERAFAKALTETDALQAEVALETARSAGARVTAEDAERIAARRAVRREAGELYQKAYEVGWGPQTRESYGKAVRYLKTAVGMEPGYADAWALMGPILLALGEKEAGDQALERALQLDPASWAVQFYEGCADTVYRQQHEKAITAFRAAIDSNPSSALAHSMLAYSLAKMGQFDESLEHAKEGVRIDPTDHGAAFQLSVQYLWNRRYEEGITAHEGLLELFPEDSFTLRNYGLLLFLAGRRQEGLQKLRTAAKLGADGGEGYLGWALAVDGQYTEARAIAEMLAREHPDLPTDPAQIYANMHEERLAIMWLKKAVAMNGELYFFEFEWDPIRSIPEVIELARRSGAPEWSLHITPGVPGK